MIDAAAKALGLSTEDLLKKLSDGKTTIADVAKAQNVDVQKVIDAMEAVANSQIARHREQAVPAVPRLPGQGWPRQGPMAGGGPGMGFGFGFGGDLRGSIDSLAKSLGISSQDLLKDLAGGQSIADIAKAKNVDINTIIDSLVDGRDREDQRRGEGQHLSQDQATKIESNLKDMITKAVNGVLQVRRDGRRQGLRSRLRVRRAGWSRRARRLPVVRPHPVRRPTRPPRFPLTRSKQRASIQLRPGRHPLDPPCHKGPPASADGPLSSR